MNLCKYGKMLEPYFGVPKEGIHRFRIMNLAVMDIIMSLIGALIISYFSGIRFIYSMLIVFLSGIILHKLLCVDTTINRLLFGKIE